MNMKKIITTLLCLMFIFTFSVTGVFAEEMASGENTSVIVPEDTPAQAETDEPGNTTDESGAADNNTEGTETSDTGPTSEDPAKTDPAQEPPVEEAVLEKPARQVIKSLQPGSRKLTVQWTPDPNENARYEIWIARDAEFTKSLVKINRKAPKDLVTKTKLKNGKTYYVKVRTYYKVNGKKYKGRWSKVKSVKVKSTAIFSDTGIEGVPEILTLRKKDDGDLLVLVNKYYTVSKGYRPADMVKIPAKYGTYGNMSLKSQAFKAYKKMLKVARKVDLDFSICSAYRSYSTQRSLFNFYIHTRGYRTAFMLSAYPGRSEHHTGLAIDIITGSNGWSLDTSFAETKEGKWVTENCAKYGFIIRYPEGKEHITGYQYEPWHLRYVGKKTAKKIMEEGITLEEYLNKTP